MHDRPVILVCEDEPALLDDICAELDEAGYVPAPVRNGNAALEALTTLTPDLILCDIAMPGLDGRALLKHIRQNRSDLSHVPFLFLTAFAERSDIIAGKRSGADDYLVKPVDYEMMLATLAAHLRQVERVTGYRIEATKKALAARDSGRFSALETLSQALVLIDADMGVIHANAAARQLAETEDAILLAETMALARNNEPLRHTVESLFDSDRDTIGAVKVAMPDSVQNFILLIGRVADECCGRPAAMVLIVDPESRHMPEPGLLQKALGLTPKEAEFAALLAKGLRRDEIAEIMGVSQTTIAYHLKNLFAKTATNRQSDLVVLLCSLATLSPCK